MTYHFDWHFRHGARTSLSAAKILAATQKVYPFKSVVDVGCGDGRWLSECAALGVEDCHGLDGPWTDRSQLRIDPGKVSICDLNKPFRIGRRFDLALSLEVAEHLEPKSAKTFVESLTALSDVVLFGAAVPYQGGYRHINEQWPSYWAAIFEEHSYQAFDLLRDQFWSDQDIHFWYRQNCLLYVSSARPDLIETFSDFIAREGIRQLPFDIVHPERYVEIASYRQIAFKALLRQLPRRAVQKVQSLIVSP